VSFFPSKDGPFPLGRRRLVKFELLGGQMGVVGFPPLPPLLLRPSSNVLEVGSFLLDRFLRSGCYTDSLSLFQLKRPFADSLLPADALCLLLKSVFRAQ